MSVEEFLDSEVKVVNIGLEDFAHVLAERDVPVVHVEWSPPAGNARTRDLLSKLGS